MLSAPHSKRNLSLLFLGQAVAGAQMPMIFTMGGLAGMSLASNPCYATLPISMIVVGTMFSATPISRFMQRYGRRAGFLLGGVFGILGALISAFGLYISSFPIFVAGSLCSGVYMSSQAFLRFAASEAVPDAFRAKAISFVMSAGLVAAIMGPQLFKLTSTAFVIPFLATYLVAAVLNLIGMGLYAFIALPKPPVHKEGAGGRTIAQMLRKPEIVVAIVVGMVSYALMNLLMTATPLAVVGCGYNSGNAADIVASHVLAMYAPALVTGFLIARFGVRTIMATGLAILFVAGIAGLTGATLSHFFTALVLLGIGWNFSFIGATTLLASAHSPEERGRIQGFNDMLVFGCVSVASFASGGLMNCSGSDAATGWSLVNIAMLPFLALAGAALIWLWLRPNEPEMNAG